MTGVAAGVQSNVTGTVSSTNGGTGTTASASVTVVAPPTIAAAFSPLTVAPAGTSTLTFTLTNPSATVGLTGLAFAETLPTGLTVATSSSSVCGGTLTTDGKHGNLVQRRHARGERLLHDQHDDYRRDCR